MISPSASSRRSGLIFLVVTAVGWGLNWPALKILLAEWPPFFARGTAGCVGAALLAVYARAIGESLSVPRETWPRLAWASFTNVFAWMGLSTASLQWLGVAEGALLVYTVPIWATLLAWPLRGTRPTLRVVVALVLSFSGVVLVFSNGGTQADMVSGSGKWPGIVLALTASILFALGMITTQRPMPIAPVASIAWQVGLGCLPMIPLGLLLEHHRIGPVSSSGWAVWIYMAIVPMAVSYAGWFATLRRLPPETAAIGTLLVPIVGVLSASYALGEPFGARQILAMVLTLSGVGLALKRSGP